MRRRAFLGAAVGAAASGCLGRADEGSYSIPSVLSDRPERVYVPTHAAGLDVVGTADAGPFRLGLFYSYPDRFWELAGRKQYLREVEDADSVHLMASAWDPETGVILPEVGLTVEVEREGELVAHEAVYAMVSQRMGFHYGDNFPLPGDGRYEVTVSVGGLPLRRTGAFEGRFGGPASATFTFEYARDAREDLPTRRPSNAGASGALEPMDGDDLPSAVAPRLDSLPGTPLGIPTTHDAVLAATLLSRESARRFGADRYLAVSPRTPHNRLLLPSMALRLRIVANGSTRREATMTRTVDPALGYHYGAPLPEAESGDELVVETLTPPQIARHEGYETAFIRMEPVRYELP